GGLPGALGPAAAGERVEAAPVPTLGNFNTAALLRPNIIIPYARAVGPAPLSNPGRLQDTKQFMSLVPSPKSPSQRCSAKPVKWRRYCRRITAIGLAAW